MPRWAGPALSCARASAALAAALAATRFSPSPTPAFFKAVERRITSVVDSDGRVRGREARDGATVGQPSRPATESR